MPLVTPFVALVFCTMIFCREDTRPDLAGTGVAGMSLSGEESVEGDIDGAPNSFDSTWADISGADCTVTITAEVGDCDGFVLGAVVGPTEG